MELSIQERLKDLRVERGLTLEQLAEETHLSKSALGSYEGDKFKDISHYALIQLAKFYEVSVDYLLCRSETKNHPNADLADLRLSDDMIEFLKSRLVDNALLCELATHPDFPRLMADLEIYVNGVAVKQVQTANAIVDTMSATIMKQYNPGLTDPQLKQLVAAHIDDDSFCRYVIQQDINKIAFDLREAHKNDFFSVPEDNPLEDFLQTAEETAREDSDPEQAALAFICKRLKLNYKKLSEEEKKWLKKIAQKSDLLKNPNPQRGRKQVGDKNKFYKTEDTMKKDDRERCSWATTELYKEYHDEEWGKPVHDDRKLFEMLVLEGMQAGLSWLTILNKRAAFKEAFNEFDYQKIALYDETKIDELMQNPNIVRNRLKIKSTITNAQQFIKIQEEYGSFDKFIWSYVKNRPIHNHFKSEADIPATTPLSDRISKDLKKRGFKFVGSTIIYAYMQAIGIVNDHVKGCYLYVPE